MSDGSEKAQSDEKIDNMRKKKKKKRWKFRNWFLVIPGDKAQWQVEVKHGKDNMEVYVNVVQYHGWCYQLFYTLHVLNKRFGLIFTKKKKGKTKLEYTWVEINPELVLTKLIRRHKRVRKGKTELLYKIIDVFKSMMLKEWLNRNIMEEDDQTETEATEIIRECSERLRETENVDGVKVLSTVKLFMVSDRYRAITSAYYRGSVDALLVYNVTRHLTFEMAKGATRTHGCEEAKAFVERMLIGNKCDLHHLVAIKTEESVAFAERESLYFMEISVLDATNVENAFTEVLTQIHKIESKRSVGGPNKEGEGGSEMELRFRSLGFKQVEEERQRLRTEKLCKDLETKTKKTEVKIQTENPETDVKESAKNPMEKRKKKRGSKSDELILEFMKKLKQADDETCMFHRLCFAIQCYRSCYKTYITIKRHLLSRLHDHKGLLDEFHQLKSGFSSPAIRNNEMK
ncbi:hypothetical protein Bca4012_018501 [Brassica carinata]